MEVEQLTNIQQLRPRQFLLPSLSDTLEDGADGNFLKAYELDGFLAVRHHPTLLLFVDQRSTIRIRICREGHLEEQELSHENEGINVAVE